LAGQEQDAVGGGFNAEESFVGELSQLVMFDYALSADEVSELAKPQDGRCAQAYGQLLSWSDVLIGERHGDVIVVNQSHCLGNLCLFLTGFYTVSQKSRYPAHVDNFAKY